MASGMIAGLVRANMPHLLGLAIYCLIAMVFSVIFYKLLIKIIPLNISFDSSPMEHLAATLLAIGVAISISLIIALNATVPPQPPPFPRSISITKGNSASKTDSGCDGGCSAKTGPQRKPRAKKAQDAGDNVPNTEADDKKIN
ncbi:MAG: hypothetical protein HZA78_10475 [Candidatus Schekmanbacteria bacterium]|nr:hypothetical protein [Candidatus Schekmanbacteria bacterium]